MEELYSTYNVQSAVLFGSYAKGNPQKNSDIDILVDGNLQGLAFYGLRKRGSRKTIGSSKVCISGYLERHYATILLPALLAYIK